MAFPEGIPESAVAAAQFRDGLRAYIDAVDALERATLAVERRAAETEAARVVADTAAEQVSAAWQALESVDEAQVLAGVAALQSLRNAEAAVDAALAAAMPAPEVGAPAAEASAAAHDASVVTTPFDPNNEGA